MPYNPKPYDTNGIILGEQLMDLTEELAKNTHENWAARRIKQGWTYGPERNDLLKQHPNLVPYELLPEFEKEYDRGTSMETLKMIRALGYEIVKSTE